MEVEKPGTLPKGQMLAGGVPKAEPGERARAGVEAVTSLLSQ